MITKETLDRLNHHSTACYNSGVFQPSIALGDYINLITAARELEAVKVEREHLLLNQRELLDTIDALRIQLDCAATAKAELAELRGLKVDEAGNDTLIDSKQRVGYVTVLFEDIIPAGNILRTLGHAFDAVNKVTQHAPSSSANAPTTTAPDSQPKV